MRKSVCSTSQPILHMPNGINGLPALSKFMVKFRISIIFPNPNGFAPQMPFFLPVFENIPLFQIEGRDMAFMIFRAIEASLFLLKEP